MCIRDSTKRHIRQSDRIYSPTEYAKMVAESSLSCKFTSALYEENFSVDYKARWTNFYKRKTFLLIVVEKFLQEESFIHRIFGKENRCV